MSDDTLETPIAEVVESVKARKRRNGKGAAALRAMAEQPGVWLTYREGQTQHQAHAYASWLRRTHPEAEWVAVKRDDDYATCGRIVPAPPDAG